MSAQISAFAPLIVHQKSFAICWMGQKGYFCVLEAMMPALPLIVSRKAHFQGIFATPMRTVWAQSVPVSTPTIQANPEG
jgi:hypothetical protein